MCTDPPTLDASLLQMCAPDAYVALPESYTQCNVIKNKAVVKMYAAALASYRSISERDRMYCSRLRCEEKYSYSWLPGGRYQLVFRGYNPPVLPSASSENVWTISILQEVTLLGGGPRNTVEPTTSAETPGYDIDGSFEYSDRMTPVGGQVLRGSASWFASDNVDSVYSVRSVAVDTTWDRREIVLDAALTLSAHV
eukprot:CAMPEP_0177443108 /NCGR_PEP_ID=MMETSP0369-20130122/5295_1 /TAXON_ID=447022 ORGANISM="Scrippsiella hangoei-like, Strain SHHI-4" /NCGR_SAMPLE_ID=MMETSP0369 /ASSEMBLY_ACC=CAM_ASM_000364 /LENGTH=195 /DNA_ID=CAMNT_0018915085 /DNA_START=11 /DNA_END=597 /DNA_ORIENTATION=+